MYHHKGLISSAVTHQNRKRTKRYQKFREALVECNMVYGEHIESRDTTIILTLTDVQWVPFGECRHKDYTPTMICYIGWLLANEPWMLTETDEWWILRTVDWLLPPRLVVIALSENIQHVRGTRNSIHSQELYIGEITMELNREEAIDENGKYILIIA